MSCNTGFDWRVLSRRRPQLRAVKCETVSSLSALLLYHGVIHPSCILLCHVFCHSVLSVCVASEYLSVYVWPLVFV